jgi:oleate hydratase
MTESSELGSMTVPPARPAQNDVRGSWALWRYIAQLSNDFGNPECFAEDTDKTLWTSFTVTLREPEFFSFMQSFTKNPPGTGGLVTFKNSRWMLSVVLSHQPHFANQPENVQVFWGYGLHPHESGDRVKKSMLECNGEEILRELAYHLQIEGEDMFSSANCIPCLMPYITSEFMPRPLSARPQVIPDGARNFGFLGQFCELPEDTVFTVEYSVRSAQTAVYGLCKTNRSITPMFKGFEQPRIVTAALKTIAMNGRI